MAAKVRRRTTTKKTYFLDTNNLLFITRVPRTATRRSAASRADAAWNVPTPHAQPVVRWPGCQVVGCAGPDNSTPRHPDNPAPGTPAVPPPLYSPLAHDPLRRHPR